MNLPVGQPFGSPAGGRTAPEFSPLTPQTPSQHYAQGAPSGYVLSPDIGLGPASATKPGAQGSSPEAGQTPAAGFCNVGSLPMPSFMPNIGVEVPAGTPPRVPKVKLFGNAAVQAWLDMPGVELAVEVTLLHGVDVMAMPPDARLLPLAINLDSTGRRTAQVGRHHQTQWFESRLSPANICCISRTAFEISWSDQSDLSVGSVFALQSLGSGIVLVNGVQVAAGQFSPILPCAEVTLASQQGGDILPLVTFALHFRSGDSATSAPRDASFSPTRRRPEPAARPMSGTWWLLCSYAQGLSCEALAAILPQQAGLVVRNGAGSTHTVIGRLQQPEVFEALLVAAPELAQFVSRNHLKLEPLVVEDGDCCCERLRLTNMSSNLLLIDELTPLPRGESALLRDGQTIGFTMHGNIPFLTFRLVAPSNRESGSSKFLALLAASPCECSGQGQEPMPDVADLDEEAPLLDCSGIDSLAVEVEQREEQSDALSLISPPKHGVKQPKSGCGLLKGISAHWKNGGS